MLAVIGCLTAVTVLVWCAAEVWRHLQASWDATWTEIDQQRRDTWR